MSRDGEFTAAWFDDASATWDDPRLSREGPLAAVWDPPNLRLWRPERGATAVLFNPNALAVSPEVRDRLSTRKGFVWLRREISPKQQQAIHKLGIPGIGFLIALRARLNAFDNEEEHATRFVRI